MKNILLVGIQYHRYTDEIITELRALGHKVAYRNIQPRNLAMKVFRVSAPGLYRRGLDRAHQRVLEDARSQSYDQVIFIQVHQMRVETLARLRELLPHAEFVLYNWDAITNHDYRAHLSYFDRAYTFDPVDAKEQGIGYLPLFCIRDFLRLARREQERRAVYFVGNIVSVQRYEALRAFKRYCRREGIVFHCFMACSIVVLWWLLRRGYLPLDVSLHSIRHDRFIAMIERSVAVFDFANHRQTGYTMRTFENLCAGKKIITSSGNIRGEAFYSDDRIFVFEGGNFEGIHTFLKQPLRDLSADFPEYHISTFVKTLTEGTVTAAPVTQTSVEFAGHVRSH
jgi:hypothetical protein